MRKSTLLALFIAVPSLTAAQPGPAQDAAHGSGTFDRSTVATVTGVVLGESRVDRGTGHPEVELLLRTTGGDMRVLLGPDYWVDTQSLRIAKGDQVQVKGSVIALDGKPSIVAETVTWGSITLDLRNASGVPAWSGYLARRIPPTWDDREEARLFDPTTVVNVPGTVLGESRTARRSGHADVHVRLGTGMGELPVHLGPDFWVDAQALGIAKGDQVRVRGSMVSIDGKPAIIAEAVTWGTATLQLRSATGAPAWTAVAPQ